MSAGLIPPVSALTQPFWDAARRRELHLQHCPECGDRPFPPRTHCPRCGAGSLPWEPVSGHATVYTYTVARRPPHPVFAPRCPLVVAVVELDEGPRMFTNLVDIDPDAVRVGMAVQVAFEPLDDSDIVLPVFRPEPGATR